MFAKLLANKVTIGDWCFANVNYQVVVKVLHNHSKPKLGLETRHIIYFVVKGIHRKTKPSSQLTCIEQLSADLHRTTIRGLASNNYPRTCIEQLSADLHRTTIRGLAR